MRLALVKAKAKKKDGGAIGGSASSPRSDRPCRANGGPANNESSSYATTPESKQKESSGDIDAVTSMRSDMKRAARTIEGKTPYVWPSSESRTGKKDGGKCMASGGKLTAKSRDAISNKNFALPGRRYPIENASHARNALARVSGNGSSEEKAEVRSAVKRKYPGIGKD